MTWSVPPGGHRPMAVPENGDAALVVPIVENPLQDVGVAAFGHAVEEVAGHQLAAIRKTSCPDVVSPLFDHVRQVEHDTAGIRLGGKDRRDQGPSAAADVDDLGGAGKIAGAQDNRFQRRRHFGHRPIEHLGGRGMVGAELPQRAAKHLVEREIACLHAREQIAPRLIVLFAELGDGEMTKRPRRAGLQPGRQAGRPETPGRVFLEPAVLQRARSRR